MIHIGVALEHQQERVVEAAGPVAFRRGQELVFEAEMVEEGAQPRVVVRAVFLDRGAGSQHLVVEWR